MVLGSFPHNTFFSNKILNISWIFSGNQLHYHLLYRSLNIREIYLVEFKLAMWEMNQGSKQNHHTKISGNQNSNHGQWTPAHGQCSTLSILQLMWLTVINMSGIFCLSIHIIVWVLRWFFFNFVWLPFILGTISYIYLFLKKVLDGIQIYIPNRLWTEQAKAIISLSQEIQQIAERTMQTNINH